MAKDKKSKKRTKSKDLEETSETAGPGGSAFDAPVEVTVTTDDLNRLTLGTLTLHFPERDVDLVLDGATAARVVAAFARPEMRGALQDRLTIDGANMRNLWAGFDLLRLLAVSWMPRVPSLATDRMTVDPPIADAAPGG